MISVILILAIKELFHLMSDLICMETYYVWMLTNIVRYFRLLVQYPAKYCNIRHYCDQD